MYILKANRNGLVPKNITLTHTKTGKVYTKTVWVKIISPNSISTESKNITPNEQLTSIGNTVTHHPSGHQIPQYVKGDIVDFLDTNGNKVTGVVAGHIKTAQNVNSTPQMSIKVNGKRFTVSEKRIVALVQQASVTNNASFVNVAVGQTPVQVPTTTVGVTNTKRKPKPATPVTATPVKDANGFPLSITVLTTVKNLGGGSGGAYLVQDADGDLYVMKKGKDASHIQEEFLAGQLYKAMGLNVPEAKLYGGDTQLTKYLVGSPYDNNDKNQFKELRSTFVAHCLIANWDVARNNDNVISSNGKLFFVDNGGSLRKRALGGNKGASFGDDVLELDSIAQRNPNIFGAMSVSEINKQISALVVPNKAKILSAIKNSGVANATTLEATMANRIKFLEDYLQGKTSTNHPDSKDLNVLQYNATNVTSFIKTNVSNNTQALNTNDILDKVQAFASVNKNPVNSYSDVMFADEGFALLSIMSEMRGYDKKPIVVDDADFAKIANEAGVNVAYRSVQLNDPKYGSYLCAKDKTYWGGVGGSAYGSGIYFAMQVGVGDHGTVAPPPNTDAYSDSRGYVTGSNNITHKVAIDRNSMNIAKYTDVSKEVSQLVKVVEKKVSDINTIRDSANKKIATLVTQNKLREAYEEKISALEKIRKVKKTMDGLEDEKFIANFAFKNFDKSEDLSAKNSVLDYSSHLTGHYAMYKGFDAVVHNVTKTYSYLVVLNRSKLIVQKSSALP